MLGRDKRSVDLTKKLPWNVCIVKPVAEKEHFEKVSYGTLKVRLYSTLFTVRQNVKHRIIIVKFKF